MRTCIVARFSLLSKNSACNCYRLRSCGQLLAEVQAAMRERGAQLRSLRVGPPGVQAGALGPHAAS